MVSTWQIFSDAGDNFRWEVSPSSKPSHQQNHHHCATPPPSLPSFHDVLLQGCSKILEDCDERNVDDTPMFRTGSGSSVVLKKSSIAKASSVLGEEFISNFNSGQPCSIGNGFSSPNSMFQTGSGKTVNISSTGLLRARALLGVDENNDDCTIQGFEPAKKKSRGADNSTCENISHLEKWQMGVNSMGAENDMLSSKLPFHMKSNFSGTESGDEDYGKLIRPVFDSISKPSPIKFNTAGGRAISVSRDALQRARNLLGDPEMDSLSNEGDAGASKFSFIKHGNSDGSFFSKENKTDSSHHFEQNPKIFVSPMKSSFARKPLEGKSETSISGTNLMGKFDAEESICKSNGKPFSSCPTKHLQENPFVPDTVLQPSMANGASPGFHRFSKLSGGPLADITNTVGIDSASKKGITTELRRIGKRSSVSPFKMPRSSKFISPFNCNFSSAPNGLPSRESEVSYCRKRVCTRYPFKHSRLYVKEFFKEPPTYSEMLEHLPEQVRKINPQTAEKYTFLDGSQPFDVENFYHMLVQSGASVQHASRE